MTLGYLNGQLIEIIVLSHNTGMRQGGLLSFKWSDIDLFRKVITVVKTKNKDPKVIPLNKTTYGMLLEKSKVVNISGSVFATRNETKISRKVFVQA